MRWLLGKNKVKLNRERKREGVMRLAPFSANMFLNYRPLMNSYSALSLVICFLCCKLCIDHGRSTTR